MRRFIFFILVCTLSIGAFIGCSISDNNSSESSPFGLLIVEAEITEITNGYFWVRTLDEDASRISVSVGGAEMLDSSGKSIQFEDFTVGDVIEIECYEILTTEPAQIYAQKVTVV